MSFWSGVKWKAKQVYEYNVRPAVKHTTLRAKAAYQREKQNRLHDKYMGGGRAWSTRIGRTARAGYKLGKTQYQAARERARDRQGTGNPRYYASGLMKRKSYRATRQQMQAKASAPRYWTAKSRNSYYGEVGRSKPRSHALNKAAWYRREARRRY